MFFSNIAMPISLAGFRILIPISRRKETRTISHPISRNMRNIDLYRCSDSCLIRLMFFFSIG